MQARVALEAGWGEGGARLAPLGEGHINETHLVTASTGRFVLQRINQAVFTDPGRVMRNLVRIRGHVEERRPGTIPELKPANDGEPAHVDEAGEWWRLWRFVEGTRSLESTSDPDVAAAAGDAFGAFQALLADLGEPRLVPTIPGFLELDGYLAAFDRALADDRSGEADEFRSAVDAHRWLADCFPPGERYVHGDCKLNNLLFSESTPTVVSVLDLDTVMPGHWAWDFGDLTRSLLMGGGDPGRVFAAVARAFVAAAAIEASVQDLVRAPIHVAVMLGVRFLTDHLQGDGYFKVGFRGENLARAQQQFDLVRRLEGARGALEAGASEALGQGPGHAAGGGG